MRGYKYVKFSRNTAKSNPEMIKREYQMLIQEEENKISELFIENNIISIQISRNNFNIIVRYYEVDGINHKESNEIDIKFSFDKIDKIHKKLIKKHEYLLKHQELLSLMKDEYYKFLQRFNT